MPCTLQGRLELEAELAELRAENARLRARVAQLEADELMRGQAALAYWGAPNPALDVPATLDARQYGCGYGFSDEYAAKIGEAVSRALARDQSNRNCRASVGMAELDPRRASADPGTPVPRNNDHEQDGA